MNGIGEISKLIETEKSSVLISTAGWSVGICQVSFVCVFVFVYFSNKPTKDILEGLVQACNVTDIVQIIPLEKLSTLGSVFRFLPPSSRLHTLYPAVEHRQVRLLLSIPMDLLNKKTARRSVRKR